MRQRGQPEVPRFLCAYGNASASERIRDSRKGFSMEIVTVYSRSGCHLCEVALEEIAKFTNQFEFQVEKIEIDGDPALEKKYGEEVPVILINGKPHDFFRVDPERFAAAMQKESRRHQ